ncbi:putative ATP-dependent RNA helicase prh1 [Lachnellula suecica]|uniref:RNA helicase n=1 Tax=Lachnellula suecica TaxID=602035 RepID=A0A8T9CD02_9HELO|nr:putative ATP-dependent RNA helicase prh1 [Lachnellula suecica]
MPEKVHQKFGDDPEPSTTIASAPFNGANGSGNGKQETKAKNTINGANEKKRLPDGTPKTPVRSNTPQASESDTIDKQKTKKAKTVASSNDEVKTNATKPLGANIIAPEKAKQGGASLKAGFAAAQRSNGASKPQQQHFKHPAQNQELARIAKTLEKTRMTLPIWSQKANIRWSLRLHDVMLLNGETGSGKSTQVPQFLYTEEWCKTERVTIEKEDGKKQEINVGGVIAITQPRRIAAITLAQRVAREMGSPLRQGQERHIEGKVGYSVRFDTLVPKGTRIKFVTEGTLLQEMLHDPYLTKYSAVIVDEIHERSVDVDLVAGFLRQIVLGDKKGRGGIPLKVVLMSATVELGGIEAFFAKKDWDPTYEPGSNYGNVLAPHIPDNERSLNELKKQEKAAPKKNAAGNTKNDKKDIVKNEKENRKGASGKINGEKHSGKKDKDDSRRSSRDSNYSEWSGISDSIANEERPKKAIPGVPEGDISPSGVGTEYVRGRQHPVVVKYEDRKPSDLLESVGSAIMNIHRREAFPGDILAFVTGQDDIETLQRLLAKEANRPDNSKDAPRMKVLPLYGSLSAEAQQAAFEPVREKFTRKIVLATNIAETSVTVSGVRYVVDCGMVKVKRYRTGLGMDSLLPTAISKVSAEQRLGRAAREAKGHCWRIYTKEQYENFGEDDIPEILRSSALEALLKMKARGVQNPFEFPLMDTPDDENMKKALEQLVSMGALDGDQNLTEVGAKMARFPLPAQYGRVIIAAAEPEADCLVEVIDILSLLTTESEIFINPKSEDDNELFESSRSDVTRREGDLLTLLTTMQRYNSENADRKIWCEKRHINARAMRMAVNIRKQLHSLCLEQKLLPERPSNQPQLFEPTSPEKAEAILKTFLRAFSTRTAVLRPDGTYLTVSPKNQIAIHPSSVLYGRKLEAIMFLEHVFTKKNYAKKVSAIQAQWIVEAMHS